MPGVRDAYSGNPSALEPVRTKRHSATEVLLQIDLQPEQRCFFGDFDVIVRDLAHAQGVLGLQLTVEPLGSADGAAFFGRALDTMTSDQNVGTYEVKIPTPKRPGLYGVFLCSGTNDQLGVVPCSRQPLRSFDEMSKPYKVDSSGLAPGAPPGEPYTAPTKVDEKVFFMQPFVIGPQSVALLSNPASPESKRVLQEAGIGDAELTRGLAEIAKFGEKLGSLPLRPEADRMQMVVPHYSHQKCAKDPMPVE